jgi:hypothetical protein
MRIPYSVAQASIDTVIYESTESNNLDTILVHWPFNFDCPGMPDQCGHDCIDKLSDQTQR